MDDQTGYERAKKRVEELKGFYHHLLVYVLVNLFLFVLNVLTSRGDWWFYWPLLGWGVGLGAHAASVFAGRGFWGKEWEERKIKQIMEKERRRHGG
ncbi:MAG: 2TM domain-containing protein [Candidatus Eisenbacteria bacterium]